MNNRLNGLTISMFSLCILGGLASIANAEDPVEMQRYLVITIDFKNDPQAVSPRFDKDLHELFKAIYANDETLLLGTRLTPRKYRCFSFRPAAGWRPTLFDQYLKVEEKLAPVVLFTTPRDQGTNVAPSQTISIQFAPVMDEQSIVDGRGVIMFAGDGSSVEGSWSKARQGTGFTFTPEENFKEGEKYKVIITTHVKNEVGTHLDEARTAEFTIGRSVVEAEARATKTPAIVESKNLPVPKTYSWDSPLLGKPISCEFYSPGNSSLKKPSIIYLKNLPSPRIGGTDDETLISGFLEEGMDVFVADYGHNPKAVAPGLLPELDQWYGFLYETETYPVDKDWIYIVPAGYTMDRGVHVCEFNGRAVGMDVIYPSDPAEPVPLMLQVTSTKETGKWINQRAYYVYGLLTAGYAGAIMDWNGTGPGAAPGGDVFPEKRAARLLRARAGDWNLSGRLGVTGHSKGSSRAGKAAFINEGDWEADRGPYADQSDRFQVALLSAGQHAPEFLIEDGFHKPVSQPNEQLRKVSTLTFVTPDDPPVFLSVGALDKPFRVAQMKRLADQCKKVGVQHRVIIQKGMDHMYNPRPQVIGHIYGFFDHYLKPQERDGHAPVDQGELDRLADQVDLPPQSAGDTARGSAEAKSYSGADASAIAALESIGAVVEVEGTGLEQSAVKVDLRSGHVTEAELQHLKRLTRLRELRLDGIPVTDDGLKYLQGMTSLQRLDLPGTRITDNGLGYLRELKNLRVLSIKDNRVTDAGLTHLQGLTQLEMLSLGPNQISDVGVKSLRHLTKLRYLNLTDTQVTDSVFEYLKPLTNLGTLRLRSTRVTEEGVQDLKQTLPDCRVSR